jgi:hypothetical protein
VEESTKLLTFNDLDARSAKEHVDLQQVWEAWKDADHLRRHSFLGTMGWESRSEREYL